MTHQGPHKNRPTEPVPEVDTVPLAHSPMRCWKQVRDGSWYAFYVNVGPNRSWGEEHPDDPNWWYNREHRNNPGPLVCRHGRVPGMCPDGTCGSEPKPPPTQDEIDHATKRVWEILHELENHG